MNRKGHFDVLEFIRELQLLLGAGLNVVEAVRALRDESSSRGNQNAATLTSSICEQLEQGNRLSQSLKATNSFSPLLCESVAAVETSGNLPAALNRYLAYVERVRKLRDQIVAALTYPAIVTAVGCAVIVFLVLYLIPKFAVVYEDMHAQLPTGSRLLFESGVWLQDHLVGLGSLAVVAIVTCVAIWRDEQSRTRISTYFADTDLLQSTLLPLELARLYRTLAMLIKSGVPIVAAVEMTIPVAATFIQLRLKSAVKMLQHGHSIVAAFQANNLATPAAVGLLHAADRAGSLGDVLESTAKFYDDMVERRFSSFLRIFEPVVLLLVAVGIGAVVILMYMPIFELVGQAA